MHFCLLVVGPDVDQQLAPFDERDERNMQDLDVTDELRSQYEVAVFTRYRGPEGRIMDPDDDDYLSVMFREPTDDEKKIIDGRVMGETEGMRWSYFHWNDDMGDGPRVFDPPKGWEKIAVPVSSRWSFAGWCCWENSWGMIWKGDPRSDEHAYGFVEVADDGTVRCFRRVAPDAKFDWYVMGGRWSGFFSLKNGASGVVGHSLSGHRRPGREAADQVRLGDVDFGNHDNRMIPEALLMDGVWSERDGERQESEAWETKIRRLYEELPPDTLLTLIDYHM